jgi:pimeloyl-ACP methyl ester carboxylesterase
MLCELPDATVNYEEFGQGRPIVMLHGLPLDHTEMIYEMEPRFAKRPGWRRIYPDMPGHGGTAGRDWMTGREDVLKVIEEFIDAVVGPERFVVVGTSYGGYIARGLVYRRSASIDGLFVNVPVIVADFSERTLPEHAILVRDERVIAQARSENMNVDSLSQLAVVQGTAVLDYARALDRGTADKEFLQKIKRRFSFDVDDLPTPFPAPALFMMGRQDQIVGYRDALAIVENYPRGTFVVLDRAGHLLAGEQTRLWPALVDEWLDRVEEWCAAG